MIWLVPRGDVVQMSHHCDGNNQPEKSAGCSGLGPQCFVRSAGRSTGSKQYCHRALAKSAGRGLGAVSGLEQPRELLQHEILVPLVPSRLQGPGPCAPGWGRP